MLWEDEEREEYESEKYAGDYHYFHKLHEDHCIVIYIFAVCF